MNLFDLFLNPEKRIILPISEYAYARQYGTPCAVMIYYRVAITKFVGECDEGSCDV